MNTRCCPTGSFFHKAWMFPDLTPERYKRLASARDLPMLRDYALRVSAAQRQGRATGETKAETSKRLREILAELGRNLGSRE